ncbi:MAG: hypothetical protein JNL49_04580 [Bacteroidia bacterium]|nr:hypothetical protein [Bacteroidia bacterium]
MTNYEFDAHLKFDIDATLEYDYLIASNYDKLKQTVTDVQHIADIRTGHPVKWTAGFEYDDNKHTLTDCFSSNIIAEYDCNESKTLAWIPQGVATIKLYILEDYEWKTGIEKLLLAIISNFIFFKTHTIESRILQRRNKQAEIFTKNELYNLLWILNAKMLIPLTDEHINKLTSYIWLKFTNGEIEPNFEYKKSIRSKNFMTVFLDTYPECHNYSVRSAVIAELNRIKGKHTQNKFASIIEKYRLTNPQSTYTEIVQMLVKKHGLKESNASRKYCQWKKVSQHTTIEYNSSDMDVGNDTFSSMCKMEKFILTYEGTEKLTQKVVSSGSGVSIAQVKRNWFLFKEQVNKIKVLNKKKI